MQTFLPYPSFVDSARALDLKRLGKQRVETFQLLRALTVPGHGWRHHPAAKMWDGHLPALVAYGLVMSDEWIARGRTDTVREKIRAFAPEVDGLDPSELDLPHWIGDPEFHRAHRSNLIRKDAEFYVPRFGDVPDDLPYIWPV
ncbi:MULTISPECIES: MSMEG_6728 family protein [Microbacterium]|uniref:MSMEG_6728 family protein n=1 Tax=Microbacterium TaxID=33882 RepID=UPI00278975B7|nr:MULTISPECIES: MSMEG_6728 family protein [Microbacterium]MDQ1083993.1 hypothetical protein [Microbacterium sp. SORGH_AS_0344]MDQ1170727.1 hypothetical protein [Microbacterium proteolyticum]